MDRAKIVARLALPLILAVPSLVSAQSKLDPSQLPKSTMFYFAWHGMPAGDVRKANALLGIWDDPEFAPVRHHVFQNTMRKAAEGKAGQPSLSPDDISQAAGLPDNEFVFGYIGNPNPPAKPSLAAQEPAKPAWNGGFFVYDHTGKEAILAKLLLQARINEKDPPKISTVTLGGISAMKLQGKDGSWYWAEQGQYSFSAGEPAVLEKISAWLKHETPAPAQLSETPSFREAGDLLQGGVAEFFFRFPSLREMNWDDNVMGFRLRPLLQNLKLEKVHSIAGQIVLQGARTRFQGAILGEAIPGSLFDIWDQGSEAPASWRFVSPNTVSYQESRINFLGIYSLLKSALQSSSPTPQQGPLDFMESAFTTKMGMSLPTALAAFTGELASLQSSPLLDPAGQVYLIGIRKKDTTLALLHHGFAERVSGERSEGETTFVKVSQGGIANAAGTASFKYYHLAITPNLLVAAARTEPVRDILALGSKTNGENVPRAWLQAREEFPKAVNGLGFFDFQKIDWVAAKEHWLALSRKAKTPPAAQGATQVDAFTQTMKDLDPRVFPRHLHLSANASWKDAHGIHFDGWIE